MIRKMSVTTGSQGLNEITEEVRSLVSESGLEEGLCTIFVQHTSASLVIQENADPSARRDLESWFSRLVVENDRLYTHTMEGADDMPSHIKSALTQVSVSIPIIGGDLALGTWQGIYLFEHRRGHSRRSVIVHVGG